MATQERDVAKLVIDAGARGSLSNESLKVLGDTQGIQGEINRSMGGALTVDETDLLLLNILVDDSGSIAASGNTASVRQGHNRVAQAVLEAGIARNVLLQTSFINGAVINPYVPLLEAGALNDTNYDPRQFGGSPIFRQSVILLGSLAAKTEELERQGKEVRSITLIITDGDDYSDIGASSVSWLATDLRKTNRHIIAAMGVDDGTTDFRKVFREMGIPDQWILLADSNHDAIINAFRNFGKAAAKASLDQDSFTRLALGPGFSS